MSPPREIRNLTLAGFMGTGKSTVGRMVATQLDFEFIDTDLQIERLAGKSISQIFAAEGEPAFRAWESQVVRELAGGNRAVISTGGGLILNPANLESLRAHSLIVCLWASPEKILERVGHHTHRPLLQGPDPLQTIRKLLAQREPHYRQADILVNSNPRSLREVAAHVIHHFNLMRAAP